MAAALANQYNDSGRYIVKKGIEEKAVETGFFKRHDLWPR